MIQPVKRVLTNWRNVQHVEQGEFVETFIPNEYKRYYVSFSGYGTVRIYRFHAVDGYEWYCNEYLEGTTRRFYKSSKPAYVAWSTNVNYIRIYGERTDGTEEIILEYVHP